MHDIQNLLFIIGRIFLALYFIVGAGFDIYMHQDTLQLMEVKKIPIFLCAGAIALKLIAGFALIFNLYILWAAIALALFTLIANIIFNNFWKETGMKRQFSAIRFMANLAIIGGLLVVISLVM